MRIFLTGATGFIGSRVCRELLDAGHQVLGMTRSQAGAAALSAMGAEAWHGELEHLPGIEQGAAQCDAVIHTAFDHDFAHFVQNCEKDRRVILALGAALEGTARPLIITSSTAMGTVDAGQAAVEDHFDPQHGNPRVASELAGLELAGCGVDVRVMRLSQIHDRVKHGLVTELIALAQRTGVSAYVGEGRNRWSAAPVTDTARLYRLVLEQGERGARYHATAQEGIAFRRIAEAVGQRLGVPVMALAPEQVGEHFGWMAGFVGKDMSASSARTRERLGWQPVGPGLLEDLV